MKRLAVAGLFLVAPLALPATRADAATTVEGLRCEHRPAPLVVDSARPRLSWRMSSDVRGQRQTAYQVIVTADGGEQVWDSGRVASSESQLVEYAGKPLAARQRLTWKVRVWDKDGRPVESRPAVFEMGLLTPADWQGAKWIARPVAAVEKPVAFDGRRMRWIWYPDAGNLAENAPSGARVLRRTVELPDGATVKSAQFALSADGRGTLFVNGERAGDGGGNTSLNVLDVRKWLRAGKNQLEVRASNGGEAAGVIGQLVVALDGSAPLVVSTDATWTATRDDAGPAVPAREVAKLGEGKLWKDLSAERTAVETTQPPTYLRKSFEIRGKVKRARLYATALGWYELHMNGKRVGDEHFAPGWTDYDRRLQYQAHDVTALVRGGKNALGAIVADGWYTGHIGLARRHMYGGYPLRFRALLVLEREGGAVEFVTTDDSWRASHGPILAADLMRGESYDARKDLGPWASASFVDEGWTKVDAITAPDVEKRLVADPGPPVRVTEELRARTVKEPKPGVFVFDLGQNMVGWVRLAVRGPAGATVTLRHAEMLNPDGTIYTTNLRRAAQTDSYVLRGTAGGETWEPRFTFHGFRYVEVTGYPGRPPLTAITGRVAHSDTAPVGRLRTSSALVNQLQHNILWGQRGNFVSIPTDCPQRDERLGWTGDAQIFARTACHNMDVASFFTKWLRDMQDAQTPSGAFPDMAPRVPGNKAGAAPGWGDAGVIVPWVMYECYGDRRLLEENYPAMARWVEYIRGQNRDLLWKNGRSADYGDWLSIGADTDKEAMATAFFAWSTRLVADAARTLGRKEDAAKYDALFGEIKGAFNRAYVAADGKVKGDTQTIYALALRFGLLPDRLRATVAKRLVDDVAKRKDHLSTGFIGVGHLLPALTETGHVDVAYRLLMQDTFPSWGYSIRHGATTIWERWDGWTAEKGFQDPGMNSFNHYSFGSVGEWLYGTVGGLSPAAPAWKKIRVRPVPGGGLTHAEAAIDSPHGKVESRWKLEGKRFRLRVRIPANTTATIELPGRPTRTGGLTAAADGSLPVGAGTYELESEI